VLALDCPRHPLVGFRIGEVSGHHRQALRESVEDVLIDGFARGLDRAARVVVQRSFRPLVEGDPDDRTVQ